MGWGGGDSAVRLEASREAVAMKMREHVARDGAEVTGRQEEFTPGV